jgi:cyanate permease
LLREIAAGQVAVRQHSTGWSLWIGTALIGLGVAVTARCPDGVVEAITPC